MGERTFLDTLNSAKSALLLLLLLQDVLMLRIMVLILGKVAIHEGFTIRWQVIMHDLVRAAVVRHCVYWHPGLWVARRDHRFRFHAWRKARVPRG